MDMDHATAIFLCLKLLAERAHDDPPNAGWFTHRAFMLGEGCTITEALEMPPPRRGPALYLVKG